MKRYTPMVLMMMLLCLGTWQSAYAQSDASFDQALQVLKVQSEQLTASETNLLEVLEGSPVEPDHALMQRTADAANAFRVDLSGPMAVGKLVALMQSPQDKTTAHSMERIMVQQAMTSADQSIAYINKLIPSIASAAVVTGVTKIRDELVAIRETLKTMPN
jgi:hypothetical protein